MDMIISVIVLAAAATLSFMSFVTLKKQMEAVREENRSHWKSVEYSLEIQSNQISNEIQEGKTFNDNAFIALNENITLSKTDVLSHIEAHDGNFNKYKGVLARQLNQVTEAVNNHDEEVVSRSISLRKLIKESSIGLAEKMDKNTRDINFITKQQAGRVITTPLKVMFEQPKVEGKSGN